jgi:hypothetical protein
MRATTAADLAAVYKLPEPPADIARLAGWEREVRRAAYCANPVRLAGRIDQADKRTGEVREAYTTEHEPDGVLLKACGNRRASVCPACAETYRRDAWHLIAAGLRGGKGIPETVAAHPRLFVTFTAPSFGAVHTKRVHPGNGNLLPCHPRNPKAKCEHGRPVACWHRHPEAEIRTLGRPLCDDCFDWTGLALWNALAPELWRRTLGVTIYRALATWPASVRPRSSGWSGSATPRWPSTRPAARFTSTPSSASTRRHLETTPSRSPHRRPDSVPSCWPRPCGWPPPPWPSPTPRSTSTVLSGWPAGATSSTCATSPATAPSCRPRRSPPTSPSTPLR